MKKNRRRATAGLKISEGEVRPSGRDFLCPQQKIDRSSFLLHFFQGISALPMIATSCFPLHHPTDPSSKGGRMGDGKEAGEEC